MIKKIITSLTVVALLIITAQIETQAQKTAMFNRFGLSAAIALPSGITPTISRGGLNADLGITVNSAASFLYNLTKNFQGEVGIGFISITPDEGDAISAFSGMVAFKNFFSDAEVRPYVGVGLSYSALPTIKDDNIETSGNFLSVLGYFGAQGYINQSQTVALFIQIGLAYNSISTTTETKIDNNSSKTTKSPTLINFGGSSVGASVYF